MSSANNNWKLVKKISLTQVLEFNLKGQLLYDNEYLSIVNLLKQEMCFLIYQDLPSVTLLE